MLTILVVDDEKLERKGIRFLLNRRSEEMEILEAANGKAACEILQHRTVDIMLTDIKMPFMDGIELVSVAHKLQPDLQIVKERIEGGANEKAVLRLFINCPFVCINFDFFWLNKARQLYMDF